MDPTVAQHIDAPPAGTDHLAWWRRQLADAPAELQLPADRQRPATCSGQVLLRELRLPPAPAGELRLAAQREGVALEVLGLATFAALLFRLSGQEDLLIGVAAPGESRLPPEPQGAAGAALDALPLRLRPRADLSFRQLLAAARDTALAAAAHAAALPAGPGPETHPWCRPRLQATYAWRRAGQAPSRQLPTGAAGPDLALTLALAGGPAAVAGGAGPAAAAGDAPDAPAGLAIELAASSDLFVAATAARLLAHYAALLRAAAAAPELRLSQLPLLSEVERHQLLLEWNDSATATPGAEAALPFVHQLVAAQARRAPAAVALRAEGRQLTYGELDREARRLAAALRAAGVGPEVRVGVCLERSPELVTAVYAVFLAGGAYVALDPALPEERLDFQLADSRLQALLTRPGRLAEVAAARGIPCFVPPWPAAAGEAVPAPALSPANVAYVIYTSGSTGRPKAVEVSHGAFRNLIAWHLRAFAVTAGDRATIIASVGFDASLWETWPYLAAGASLDVVPAAVRSSPEQLRDWLAGAAATVSWLPVPLAEPLADLPWDLGDGRRPALRLLLTGGDRLVRRPPPSLPFLVVDTYGPTEAAVISTGGPVPSEDRHGRQAQPPTVGRPIDNARVYVVDASGGEAGPAPPGVPGELLISGAGLARGYLDRPELTAERFVPDAFGAAPGARLYRTGDLVRWLPHGEIEFLGRIDHQLKLRGFRIELGEIEVVLGRHPAVREAAALLVSGTLLAFVTALRPPDAGELRAHLARQLPDYMVPARFVVLEALPHTANGKLDRRALARLAEDGEDGAGDAGGRDGDDGDRRLGSRTPLEEIVAGIWSELLPGARFDVDSNFLELGGHSLLLAQLVARLRQALGVEVPLAGLFRQPTVAAMAALVEQARLGKVAADLPVLPPLRRVPRGGRPLPLSYAQERVWFIDQLAAGGNMAYNFQAAIGIRGPLRVELLARALGEIVRRHEVLRTTFPAVDGLPIQLVHPPAGFALPVIDLGRLPAARRQERAEALVRQLIRTRFDLERGPLFHWRLLRLDAAAHELVQVEHHFVHDGWSFAVLQQEIKLLYEAFWRGEPSPLPEPAVQYADFAVWQREWMEGPVIERLLDHWRGRLAGSPPPLELLGDRPRPPQASFRGDVRRPAIAPELYAALRRFARREGMTLYMTMLAGFLTLLHRYTGEQDVVIGTSNANRRAREIEGMLGMVVNTLVLRADLHGRPSWRQLLVRVRDLALQVHAYQDMPFERLVRELRVERRPGRNPLYQILFNFHDAPEPDGRIADLEAVPKVRGNGTAKMDLNVIVIPRAEQRVGRAESAQDRDAILHWEYSTDLFDTATMLRMMGHYQALLAAAAADPELELAEIPLLSPGERTALLCSWNDTASDVPRDASLPELFDLQAARSPAATAVACGASRLSYAELAAWSNRLAHHLRRRGAGPGVHVALAVERSPDLVPAILGILKSGAAYVPLDPAAPPEGLAWMLADSGCRLLVAQEHLLARLPAAGPSIVALPRDREEIERQPATAPAPAPGPGDVAYVMYAAGAAGTPAGVMVTHRAIVSRVMGGGAARRGPGEILLQLSPLGFDASTFAPWEALLHGGRLALFPPDSPSTQGVAAAIASHGATTTFLTATLFHQMAAGDLAGLGPLAELRIGGEAISPAHVQQTLAALPDLSLAACYGPTEAAAGATRLALTRSSPRGAAVPLGRPLTDTRVFVVDGALRPLPIGVPGELLIGGDGLALGYLGRPALTAERFVPDPFAARAGGRPGDRLYRSGDRVRWLADGTLDLLGRLDRQALARREPKAPVPAERSGQEAEAPPLTPMEEAVAAIWCEVLGLASVGAEDDFFVLGGHSLALTRVRSRLRKQLGVELQMPALFERPVLSDMAAAVAAAVAAHHPDGPDGRRPASAPPTPAAELSDAELDDLLARMAGEP
jgi:amino acid adenylation domain-containing protein